MREIKIGTRGSQLALFQANYVKEILTNLFPQYSISLEIIKTKGDKILDVALSKIGDKGLFTKELEIALEENTIDIAVHSLKDMPTQLPSGLKLGAVTEREDVRDALVSRNHLNLNELTHNHKIATSSLRRKASLLHYNKKFQIIDIRGNVNTRLEKMETGYCDAMIMAYAGLKRLGFEKFITEIIPPDVIMPAVSQGAIGIETRQKDAFMDTCMAKINHLPTWQAITAERAYMRILEGGCQVPVGCYAQLTESTITLTGFIASTNGIEYLKESQTGSINDAEKIGIQLAETLINRGGRRLLNEIRIS